MRGRRTARVLSDASWPRPLNKYVGTSPIAAMLSPASAGPKMRDVCMIVWLIDSALIRCCRGTRLGVIDVRHACVVDEDI